ncbi:hypothetical protein [Photorhabdus sp. CRCIA-P01]|uniref:hypothetical protein n=1 Tax=Photorhabdus sp. CRCIA-P01 TaxID=2019570 RepID=UPI0013004D45|nr:hypothetical protein [Photorhabdus sp. CRCIA-P01]
MSAEADGVTTDSPCGVIVVPPVTGQIQPFFLCAAGCPDKSLGDARHIAFALFLNG